MYMKSEVEEIMNEVEQCMCSDGGVTVTIGEPKP